MGALQQGLMIVVRLALMLVGAALVLGLMALALVFALVLATVSLLSGRRHPVQVLWQGARRTRQRVWRAARGGDADLGSGLRRDARTKPPMDDVTDVTDVRDLNQR